MNYQILALVFANIIWGAAVPIFKFSLGNIPPFIFLFIRFFFAALLFTPFLIGRWQKMNVRDWVEMIACAVIGLSLSIAFLFIGLTKAPSINFPIIHSASPIIIYISSLIFLREKPHKKVLGGSIISFVGVLIIVLFPLLTSGVAMGELSGNIYFILATLSSAAFVIMSKPLLKRINVVQSMFLLFFIASLTYLPFAVGELQSWSFDMLDWRGWVGIIFGTIFSSALAHFLMLWAEKRVDAQEVGLYAYIDPVITVLIAIPLLGEIPTPHYYIGAVLVFIGIIVAEGRLHWHPIHKLKK